MDRVFSLLGCGFSTTFMCHLLISPCPHPILYQTLCLKGLQPSWALWASLARSHFFLFIIVIWPSLIPRTVLPKTQTKKLFSLCSSNFSTIPKRTRRGKWSCLSLPVSDLAEISIVANSLPFLVLGAPSSLLRFSMSPSPLCLDYSLTGPHVEPDILHNK